jgi:hypothetical protein
MFKKIKRNIYKPAKKIKKRVVRAFKPFCDRVFFKQYLRNDIPVLVYQMGKVASSSVTHSLSRQCSGVVLQAHYFRPNHKDWRVRRLYHWIMEGAKPLNVISLTRDPIGRNVSVFFQNFEKHTGVPYHKANFSIEELRTIFLNRFANGKPLGWYDRNIKANFGIDVYTTSFPKCGFATYTHKNFRLLVLQSEIDDNEKQRAIGEFLNINNFQLFNKNISADKEYASTYMDFKRNVKLPSDYLDLMCKSKYFTHFYDQDVIDAVRIKWSYK